MCIPSRAEAALTGGTLQVLARMLIGRLNAIKPSEQVDRMNMVRLMIIDGVVPCAARFIVELEQLD